MRIEADEIRTYLQCRTRFALLHSSPPLPEVQDAMVPTYLYAERLLKAARYVLAHAHEPSLTEASLREYWSSLWAAADSKRFPRTLKGVLIQGYRRLLWMYRQLHRVPYQVIAAGIRHDISLQHHRIMVDLDLVRETASGVELDIAADVGRVPKFVLDRDPIIGLQALALEEVFHVRRLPIRVFSIDAGYVGLTLRDGRSLQRLKSTITRLLDEMEQVKPIPHFGAHCVRCPVKVACVKENPR